MDKHIGKIRPQVLLALLALGGLGLYGLRVGQIEVVVGCVTGIAALAKDVINSDSN